MRGLKFATPAELKSSRETWLTCDVGPNFLKLVREAINSSSSDAANQLAQFYAVDLIQIAMNKVK